MPIKITRAEYEAKFGMKPPVSGASAEPAKQKESNVTKGFFGKVGDFLGIEKLGRGIGAALPSFVPGSIRNQQRIQETADADNSQRLMGSLRTAMDLKKRQQAEGKDTKQADSAISMIRQQLGQASVDVEGQLSDLQPRDIAGSALSTASLLLPGAPKGTGTLGKIGIGAAEGYAMDVGSQLQDDSKTVGEAFRPGVGTAVGAVLPGIGALSKNFLRKAPVALEKASLRMTPVEKQALAKQGKDVATYLADKKIVGTPEKRLAKVENLYNQMEDRVQDVIKDANPKFSKDQVIADILSVPERFSEDVAVYDDAVKTAEKVADFFRKKAPSEISGTLLNKYKRQLSKRAFSKNNAEVVNESLHAISDLFKGKLDETVPGLQALNGEYGTLIAARKALFKAQSRNQLGVIGKMSSGIAGGALGNAIGGPVGAAVGVPLATSMASKASTPLRSATGAAIKGIDQLIEKIPSDRFGNLKITRKALIRLLQSGSDREGQ